ncbi:MAG: bifunctional phosphoserine phosphatase/homoserine phosphotransferase ThrH [Verrucomicrobia bacterium]|nr:bifunctional phosphoserine phosphatase/homoserine phosphotransferase ThrH [Prolixibacteraceae bacterium]
MRLICLDVEGVLLPEIWINVAHKTGIKELERTTRDEPDYRKLMQARIQILKDNKLTIHDIRAVIGTMEPMEGARIFLDGLRSRCQVILLSDTFVEFAQPLMEKLGWPTLFCNSLVIDADGVIQDFALRQEDGKKKAVQAHQGLNFEVFASGDSYNDLSMIQTADRGAFFHAPARILEENPTIPSFTAYGALSQFLLDGLE